MYKNLQGVAMEIINPNSNGNPFGDVQPMGCGSEALAPPNLGGGGEGGGGCRYFVDGPCKGVLALN